MASEYSSYLHEWVQKQEKTRHQAALNADQVRHQSQLNYLSTATYPYEPQVTSPSVKHIEEDFKRLIKEELEKQRPIVKLDPTHSHFMIQSLHEDYCMCGHKVKR